MCQKYQLFNMDKEKQITPLANSENIFVQSNDFIQAKYKDSITFWEMIIFGHMCTLIDPNDIDFKEYRVYFKDLLCIAKVKKTGPVYDRILEAAPSSFKNIGSYFAGRGLEKACGSLLLRLNDPPIIEGIFT